MKILFVSPKHGRDRWVFHHAFAYLSGYIKKYIPEIVIDYVDVNKEGMGGLHEKCSVNQYEIIAITGLTSHYASVK